MAIQVLLNSPKLWIDDGSFGNVDPQKTTENALASLEIADRTDIPVSKGADKPMTRSFGGGAVRARDDGTGNTFVKQVNIVFTIYKSTL
jgi:inosine-uridine nucleoside N-ribohydrolase